MTDILDGYEVSWVPSVTEVEQEEWDKLAKPAQFPFLEWNWLRLVEQSKSASPETGWLPAHLLVRTEGRLVGLAPLYVRDQSDGEFIFDRVWFEVAQKGGIAYYPKVVGMSPFTPASGYKFLIADDVCSAKITDIICHTIDRFCSVNGLGSCAFNFADTDWVSGMDKYGYAAWQHQGYVWRNNDFRDFDHWLTTLNSNRRKTVRRERKTLRNEDIRIETLTGYEIPEEYFSMMYACYESTNDKFGVWSCKYLNADFFRGLKKSMRENLLFIVAYSGDNPDPIAFSMYVFSGDKLWGRYWGCFEEVRFLHFELCYYTPIEWAIANGIRTYDPGMGGEHKARRGFFSTPSYSLHKFTERSMDLTFKTYIQEVNTLENGYITEMNKLMPFGKIPTDEDA
ncbi:GNAT family N-acetyltransferase [Maridesulfovibrio zosterae]|uniref:GNAT family N-acetyltransferase n=1 Tax=Maridesulfovibrio zosterae TaxID=82171 RepID=UPI000422E4E1|nr:GNAT family N-acetyltransferase [Maridesulfovibrio zosterae]